MLRRNNYAIEQDILAALILNGPLKLTNIGCIANINSNKLKKLLENLTENRFIIQKSTTKDDSLYLITSKGLKFYRKSKNKVMLIG
jgi:predicted transcriptional regulator